MNWLDRAKREIQKTPSQGTDNTAETPISTVTAVVHPGISGKSRGSERVIDLAREKRIRAVIDKLAQSSESVRYVLEAHDDIDRHHIVVTVAIRGKGACEMSIEREKWDPMRFLEMVEQIQ